MSVCVVSARDVSVCQWVVSGPVVCACVCLSGAVSVECVVCVVSLSCVVCVCGLA